MGAGRQPFCVEGCPHGPSQVLNSRRNLRSVDDPLRWILADLGGRPHWLSTHNRFMMRREGLQKGNSGKKATKKSELLDGRPHQGREKEEEAGGESQFGSSGASLKLGAKVGCCHDCKCENA